MNSTRTDSAATTVGQRFVAAIADKDDAALTELLATDVDFRAVTPGTAWEAHGREQVRDIVLGTWFGPGRTIERVSALTVDASLPVARVGYRFDATLPDGRFQVEQQALYRCSHGSIDELRICCTGFLPVDPDV